MDCSCDLIQTPVLTSGICSKSEGKGIFFLYVKDTEYEIYSFSFTSPNRVLKHIFLVLLCHCLFILRMMVRCSSLALKGIKLVSLGVGTGFHVYPTIKVHTSSTLTDRTEIAAFFNGSCLKGRLAKLQTN